MVAHTVHMRPRLIRGVENVKGEKREPPKPSELVLDALEIPEHDLSNESETSSCG